MIKMLTNIFVFIVLISSTVYSQTVVDAPWSNCDIPSINKIEKWLNNSMKEVKKTINEGRDYNGKNHKLEECKINELNNLFNRLKFQYDCSCGECANGSPSPPYAVGIPTITICQPLDMYLNSSKNDLDTSPPTTMCGCIQGLILHELVHAAGDPTEEGAVDCSKILYPCASDPGNDESSDHKNCKCCEKKGK